MLGVLGVLAAIGLSGSPARADTLADCLGQHHVCVTNDGRSLVSQSQQTQLEQAIGNDDIYLVAAASGSAGYDAAMRQIIGTLGGEKKQFVVGFLDSRLQHFGADNRGVLEAGAAANIATTVVQQHQSDRDIFAALQDFVRDVQKEAQDPGSSGAAASPPSHTLRNVLIVLGVILLVVVLAGLFIWRPRRLRRQRELAEAKAAAQDDLLALSNRITDHQNDVSVQSNPEAAAEQAAALASYERGTAALDAARRPGDMEAVSRNIAEGQYRLACAEAVANGEPKPGRRPMCFFDPRHGMSVADVSWAPPDGGPSRLVPVCAMDLRKIEQGIQPEIRRVEDTSGARVPYVNTGFAPGVLGRFRLRRSRARRLPARRGARVTADLPQRVRLRGPGILWRRGQLRRRGLRRRRRQRLRRRRLRRRRLRRRGYGWRGLRRRRFRRRGRGLLAAVSGPRRDRHGRQQRRHPLAARLDT
jgi:hypothetical protein